MKASLDYYQANFSPYQFHQARFLEFPGYADFAQAFANTIPWSEDLFFTANYRRPDEDRLGHLRRRPRDRRTSGGPTRSSAPTCRARPRCRRPWPQYSALMVMKQTYGEASIRKFLKFELDSYLRARGGDLVEELPLARVENQPYIHYRKGSLVMYRLQHQMGEDAVNRAAAPAARRLRLQGRALSDQLSGPAGRPARRGPAPTQQALITDLFEKITLYDLQDQGGDQRQAPDGRFDDHPDRRGQEAVRPTARARRPPRPRWTR